MQIKSRASWGAGPNGRVNRGALAMAALIAITVHWPGGGTNLTRLRGAQVAALLRSWQAQHRRQGWGDIGYNFLIDGGGTVWEGCGLYRGAHAGSVAGNYTSVGVQLIYGTNEQPTMAQLVALARFRLWLLVRAVRATLLRPHSYWTSTACPGPVRAVLSTIPGLIKGNAGAPSATTAPSTKEGIFGMTTLRILTRSKDIKFTGRRRLPLVDSAAASSSTSCLSPGKGDLDYMTEFWLAIQGIPKDRRVLVRVVHERGGKITGHSSWKAIHGTDGTTDYDQISHFGTLANHHRMRLEVDTRGLPVTVAHIKTRVRYGR